MQQILALILLVLCFCLASAVQSGQIIFKPSGGYPLNDYQTWDIDLSSYGESVAFNFSFISINSDTSTAVPYCGSDYLTVFETEFEYIARYDFCGTYNTGIPGEKFIEYEWEGQTGVTLTDMVNYELEDPWAKFMFGSDLLPGPHSQGFVLNWWGVEPTMEWEAFPVGNQGIFPINEISYLYLEVLGEFYRGQTYVPSTFRIDRLDGTTQYPLGAGDYWAETTGDFYFNLTSSVQHFRIVATTDYGHEAYKDFFVTAIQTQEPDFTSKLILVSGGNPIGYNSFKVEQADFGFSPIVFIINASNSNQAIQTTAESFSQKIYSDESGGYFSEDINSLTGADFDDRFRFEYQVGDAGSNKIIIGLGIYNISLQAISTADNTTTISCDDTFVQPGAEVKCDVFPKSDSTRVYVNGLGGAFFLLEAPFGCTQCGDDTGPSTPALGAPADQYSKTFTMSDTTGEHRVYLTGFNEVYRSIYVYGNASTDSSIRCLDSRISAGRSTTCFISADAATFSESYAIQISPPWGSVSNIVSNSSSAVSNAFFFVYTSNHTFYNETESITLTLLVDGVNYNQSFQVQVSPRPASTSISCPTYVEFGSDLGTCQVRTFLEDDKATPLSVYADAVSVSTSNTAIANVESYYYSSGRASEYFFELILETVGEVIVTVNSGEESESSALVTIWTQPNCASQIVCDESVYVGDTLYCEITAYFNETQVITQSNNFKTAAVATTDSSYRDSHNYKNLPSTATSSFDFDGEVYLYGDHVNKNSSYAYTFSTEFTAPSFSGYSEVVALVEKSESAYCYVAAASQPLVYDIPDKTSTLSCHSNTPTVNIEFICQVELKKNNATIYGLSSWVREGVSSSLAPTCQDCEFIQWVTQSGSTIRFKMKINSVNNPITLSSDYYPTLTLVGRPPSKFIVTPSNYASYDFDFKLVDDTQYNNFDSLRLSLENSEYEYYMIQTSTADTLFEDPFEFSSSSDADSTFNMVSTSCNSWYCFGVSHNGIVYNWGGDESKNGADYVDEAKFSDNQLVEVSGLDDYDIVQVHVTCRTTKDERYYNDVGAFLLTSDGKLLHHWKSGNQMVWYYIATWDSTDSCTTTQKCGSSTCPCYTIDSPIYHMTKDGFYIMFVTTSNTVYSFTSYDIPKDSSREEISDEYSLEIGRGGQKQEIGVVDVDLSPGATVVHIDNGGIVGCSGGAIVTDDGNVYTWGELASRFDLSGETTPLENDLSINGETATGVWMRDYPLDMLVVLTDAGNVWYYMADSWATTSLTKSDFRDITFLDAGREMVVLVDSTGVISTVTIEKDDVNILEVDMSGVDADGVFNYGQLYVADFVYLSLDLPDVVIDPSLVNTGCKAGVCSTLRDALEQYGQYQGITYILADNITHSLSLDSDFTLGTAASDMRIVSQHVHDGNGPDWPTIENTALVCENEACIAFENVANLYLAGFTLTRSSTAASTPLWTIDSQSVDAEYMRFFNGTNGDGGCISCSGCSLTFNAVKFESCTATGDGGCLSGDGATIGLVDVSFDRCRAESGQGGSIYLSNSQLTWTRGQVTNSKADSGGGLYLYVTQANIDLVDFSNNAAVKGGAVSAKNGILYLTNAELKTNQASDFGGAVALTYTTFTLDNAKFESNHAVEYAGALYLLGDEATTISNSEFSGNLANEGGAVFITFGEPVFTSCTFVRNRATEYGGVMALETDATATISDCVFTSNNATWGGVYSFDDCRDTVISGNQYQMNHATEYGGVVFSQGLMKIEFENSDFDYNSALAGGVFYWQEAEPVSAVNNTFNSNWAGQGGIIATPAYRLTWTQDFPLGYEAASNELFTVDLRIELKDRYNQTLIKNEAIPINIQVPSSSSANVIGQTSGALIGGVYDIGLTYESAIGITLTPDSSAEFYASVSLNSATIESPRLGVYFRECVPGEYVMSDRCSDCSVGAYSVNNSQAECQNCEVGRFQDRAGLSFCHDCPAGRSSRTLTGLTACALCDVGTFTSVNGSSTCDECATGYVQPLPGQTSCNQCTGGTYAANEGLTTCTDCLSGWYQQYSGESSCDQCPSNAEDISNHTQCACSVGYYGTITSEATVNATYTFTCEACPAGANCDSINTWKTSVQAMSGYFAGIDGTNEEFFVCVNDACQGAGICDEYYTGSTCSTCTDDAGHTTTYECAPCPEPTLNKIKLVGIVLLMLIGSFLFVWNSIRSALDGRTAIQSLIQILTSGLQFNSIASSFDMDWPSIVITLLYYQDRAGNFANEMMSIDCFLENNGGALSPFQIKTITFAILPVLILVVPGPICYAIYARKKEGDWKQNIKDTWITAIVILLFLVHPSVTQQCFAIFSCKRVGTRDEDWYISADLEEQCYTTEHFVFMMLVGIPMLLLYVIGIPCGGLYFIHKAHKADPENALPSPALRKKFGFLYWGFHPNRYWWSVSVAFRKICLLIVAAFFNYNVHVQALLSLLVVGGALAAELKYLPFKHAIVERLEMISLLSSFVTFYCGQFGFVDDLDDGSRNFLAGFIIVFNLGFLLMCLHLAISVFSGAFKELKEHTTKVKGWWTKSGNRKRTFDDDDNDKTKTISSVKTEDEEMKEHKSSGPTMNVFIDTGDEKSSEQAPLPGQLLSPVDNKNKNKNKKNDKNDGIHSSSASKYLANAPPSSASSPAPAVENSTGKKEDEQSEISQGEKKPLLTGSVTTATSNSNDGNIGLPTGVGL